MLSSASSSSAAAATANTVNIMSIKGDAEPTNNNNNIEEEVRCFLTKLQLFKVLEQGRVFCELSEVVMRLEKKGIW